MNKNEITPVQIAIRIVIIIVVIIILLLVSFAMVRFVPKVISSLGNFKNIFGNKEKLEVSLDEKSIPQEGDTVLSVTQINGEDEGQYELSFSCSKIDSDTHVELIQDSDREILLCDNVYVLPQSPDAGETSSITIKPISEDVSYDQEMQISVKHSNASSTLASAAAVLTIEGDTDSFEDEVVSTTTSTTVSRPATHSTNTTYSSIPADLTVRMGAVNVAPNGMTSMTFYVSNIGGQSSGGWSFRAFLPRSTGQTTYDSGYQPSIPPGGTSTMYLTFGNAKAGNIVISVDNNNQIRENNENNNQTSTTLR